MPPKPKFTREEVVAAALELVRQEGSQALTTRALGQRLGSSARPIFTVFANVEELHAEVRAAAMKYFEDYVGQAENYTPAFKQVGVQMLRFACREQELFRLLFMEVHPNAAGIEGLRKILGNMVQLCTGFIRRDYGFSEKDAERLFDHMWIYTYGVGVLCATGMCCFTEEELTDMLGKEFMALATLIRSGDYQYPSPRPIPTKKEETT